MSVIKSAYFNNITIDSINCYLIDDIHRVKACLKKMQESGYIDITLSNLPPSTAGSIKLNDVFIFVFLYVCIYLCIYEFIRTLIYLLIYLFIYLFIHLFIHSFIHLLIYL